MNRTSLMYFLLMALSSIIAAATELRLDRRSKFILCFLNSPLLHPFGTFQHYYTLIPIEIYRFGSWILHITNESCIVGPCFSIHSTCTNCCGNFCCSPEDDCIGGRCRLPPPPPPTTVAPVVSLAEWAPDGCVTNDDGTVSCHDEAPLYQIKGSSFSEGSVDVGIILWGWNACLGRRPLKVSMLAALSGQQSLLILMWSTAMETLMGST